MEVIVLAGGFGTRLKHVVSDVPKPMASVNGKPFLQYIFDYLQKNGAKHVVLAVGYRADFIKSFFGDLYQGINITYSFEDTPLGTGGAIKKALKYCVNEDIFVLNGDTYFDVNLNNMNDFHRDNGSNLTLAVKPMCNFDRYGSVITENNKIVKFEEKKSKIQGKINGGTYLIKKELFDAIDGQAFSFEKVVLESNVVDLYAFESDGYFIDIGVPEDYYKAQNDFVYI